MPEVTAFAMVGALDRWPGGFTPLHLLRLEENDRPAWILTDLHDELAAPRVLIPSREERILVDGLLLVGLAAAAEQTLLAAAAEFGVDGNAGRIDLVGQGGLDKLDEQVGQALHGRVQIHLALEPGSTVAGQLDELRRLDVNHRIFTPSQ